MTKQPNLPPPKPLELGIWKTVGQIVQFHLWKAHSEFTQAIMHLESRDGKYVEQIVKLKEFQKEVRGIIKEIGTA